MPTQFRDASGQERLLGTIYVPGASVGDVFTVQADGSLAPAPGGGSQAGTAYIVGPYAVDFSDIPNAGNGKNLFTIPSGQLLLTWWPDPDTFVSPDDGVSSGFAQIALGIGSSFDASAGNQLGHFNPGVAANDGEVASVAGQRLNAAQDEEDTPLTNPAHAGSSVVRAAAPATNPHPLTAGHADLFFLLCTAPAVI